MNPIDGKLKTMKNPKPRLRTLQKFLGRWMAMKNGFSKSFKSSGAFGLIGIDFRTKTFFQKFKELFLVNFSRIA